MKNLIKTTCAIIALSATSAFADAKIQATVVDMQETYRSVVKEVPVKSCEIVEVPVYGTRKTGQASTGDALVGAIIGGAIGNQFGAGSGKDAATVLGAILGADAANKKGGKQETVIVGYKQVEQCSTAYQSKNTKVRVRNRVTVETVTGDRFTFKTEQWYKRGTIIFLNVSL